MIIPLNKMPRQSEGGTLIEATLFCHSCLFFARVNAHFPYRIFCLFVLTDHQYFTKGEQVPKKSRKQGCGHTPAPLFSGLYKLFCDLLIMDFQSIDIVR